MMIIDSGLLFRPLCLAKHRPMCSMTVIDQDLVLLCANTESHLQQYSLDLVQCWISGRRRCDQKRPTQRRLIV